MNIKVIRNFSLLSVVGIAVYKGLNHQIVGGGPSGSPPLDTFCPFGGVETFYNFVTAGTYLEKTNSSNFFLLGAVLLLTILTGASFCSWLCPFGAIQEWLSKAGKRIFGRQFNLPRTIDKPLRYLRFIVLFLVVYLTVKGASLVFETYDPFKVLFHLNFESTTAYVILGLTILISLLIDRAWCKYLCPFGAIITTLGSLSLIKVKRNPDECINCDKCSKACTLGIDVANQLVTPESECVKCLDCVEACPKEKALQLSLGGVGK